MAKWTLRRRANRAPSAAVARGTGAAPTATPAPAPVPAPASTERVVRVAQAVRSAPSTERVLRVSQAVRPAPATPAERVVRVAQHVAAPAAAEAEADPTIALAAAALAAEGASARGAAASAGDESAGGVLVAERPPRLTEVPDDAIVVGGRPPRRRLRDSTPVLLLRAAHPRQAVLTALALGGAAAVIGRDSREAVAVLVTALIGQSVIGWHNDLVDRVRDSRHDVENKPIADGRLDPGTAWYAIVVAVLALVPLSITTGITAGIYYLLSVAVAMLGHYVLRTGFWSWVPWAVSFALLPAYLTYGGWGGQAVGDPPEPAIVVLAALLGIGVHVVRSVFGLVADHADEWTYLPLRLGLRLGATRLLTLGSLYIAVVVIAMAVVGVQSGSSS